MLNTTKLVANRYFITGTDTGIGKTYITCQLLRALQQQNKTAIGIKPLLAGTDATPSDTELLMQHNSVPLNKSIITPISFTLPTSPHIAAEKEKKKIDVAYILQQSEPALSQAVDIVLMEGIGGWQVPLNDHETTADLAKAFAAPVILVIGIRLGCLNHALLTAQAIQSSGLMLAGWVANQIDPSFTFYNDYIASLNKRIDAPCLGEVNFLNTNERS